MGWRGALRSMAAAARQAERAERRRLQDAQRRRALREKLAELEQAQLEVEEYEARLDVLKSIHRECGDRIDWAAIARSQAPEPPSRGTTNEDAAKATLEAYRPGWFAQLFGTAEKRRRQLQEDVESGREADSRAFEAAGREHAESMSEWRAETALARRLLAREVNAYIDAAKVVNPLNEVAGLGTSLTLRVNPDWPDRMMINLRVAEGDVVPAQIPSLTARGKLSLKAMPKGTSNEIYQDYVCGASMRVARELLAALPIEILMVNAVADLLNPATGHVEEQTILAVAFTRSGMARLNFASLDPSDSLRNFVHRMKFKKGAGMSAVDPCKWDDLPAEGAAASRATAR